jgi:hypothetical protein
MWHAWPVGENKKKKEDLTFFEASDRSRGFWLRERDSMFARFFSRGRFVRTTVLTDTVRYIIPLWKKHRSV